MRPYWSVFGWFRRNAAVIVAATALVCANVQCSDTVSPDPPARIAVDSGNDQYSLRGTQLTDPLVVRVTTEYGAVPRSAKVVFTVLEGGGAVSQSVVPTDSRGRASTELTLGPQTGLNVVGAAIEENPSRFVLFNATAANFYCPEAEDTLRMTYGGQGELFLATPKSKLYASVSEPTHPGVVRIRLTSPPTVTSFSDLEPEGFLSAVIYDAAFSPRGDFYVARRVISPEIIKIDQSGKISHFADLERPVDPEGDVFVEITTNPSGLIVGCDQIGPFLVECRNVITRFPEATYPGDVNTDAVAVDPRRHAAHPNGEDIYFIYKADSTLRRLPMNGLSVEAPGVPAAVAAQLTAAQARGARGMVCDDDGTVYIVVDTAQSKQLLKILPDGTVIVAFDFFTRGSGNASGIQRDLALDPTTRHVFTVDTLNDKLVAYDVVGGQFKEDVFPASDENISRSGAFEERVGLAVLPIFR